MRAAAQAQFDTELEQEYGGLTRPPCRRRSKW
jgi:hypothetical protein